MKILMSGRKLRYNAEYFYERAFKNLGHEVIFLDSYSGVSSPLLSRTIHARASISRLLPGSYPINEHLLETAEKIDPDAIFIVKGEFISNRTLEELGHNYNLYLFYPDNYRFLPLLKGRLHYFSAIYTAANKTDFYKELGAKQVITVPWACEPEFHRKLDYEKSYRVSFIGTAYPERRALVRKLGNVNVFGNYWFGFGKFSHPPVFGEDYVRVINQSAVNLNIQGKGSITADSPTMRTFEIASSGGFQISDYMPSVKQYFPMMVTFRDVGELKELIDYYLDSFEDANIIAENVRTVAVENFTYEQAARTIISKFI
ncbi:MAG: glycosyltransferase [Thermoplasmatales archaeon]